MKTIVCIIAAAIGLAVPAFAHASPAYLTEDVGLMAGPAQGYPLVDDLQSGDAVDVRGCTDGWTWCDVAADGERGWVPGDALEMDEGGQWYPVPEYAPNYGIPVVVFSIQSYWPAYYSYYPFYVDRWSWYRWQLPYVVPLPHPIFGSNGNPPPRVVPLPHPIFGSNGNPPPRVVPLPHPIFGSNGNPPPRVVPLPHPIFGSNGNPPPRVVPLPHPIFNGNPPTVRRMPPPPHPHPLPRSDLRRHA